MTSTNGNHFIIPAWGVSLTLHGLLVGLAFVFTAQVTPILPEEVFKWDVALVEGAKPDAKLEQVESVVAQAPSSAKKVFSSQPKPVVTPSQPATQIEQVVEPPRPVIDPVQPIERKVEVPQVREEPVEQRIVEVAEPTPEPVAVAALPESVEPQPTPSVSTMSADEPIPQETSALTASPQGSAMDAVPVQVSKASATGPDAKADNRWLAESLWRRVAELKRYPSIARLNGQEGKVILKAVIRSDGQLADVFVQKSSGYSALDEAAIEAVKLACPLHMKHAIGKPQIVVSLPIVYSLAN